MAKATSTRKIAIEEAKAKEESAKLLAKAEVERAKGIAEANKFIENIQDGNKEIIYIPTESNLPILESGRFRSHTPKK